MAVATLHLAIHAGTVTLVPAIAEADLAEVPPDQIDYNAPTLVSREREAEIPDFLWWTPQTVLLFVSQLVS